MPESVIHKRVAQLGSKYARILWDRQEGRCFWCGKRMSRTRFTSPARPKDLDDIVATIDHLVPLALGGDNTLDNLRLACHRCNHLRGLWLQPIALAAQNRVLRQRALQLTCDLRSKEEQIKQNLTLLNRLADALAGWTELSFVGVLKRAWQEWRGGFISFSR